MTFRLYGKIVKRSLRHMKPQNKEPYDLYQLVIEEPGLYPSRFQVGTRDASLFGDKDGPYAVGNFAVVQGFINGSERPAKRSDGSAFTAYSTYLTARSIEPSGAPDTSATQHTAPTAEDLEDIPF